jgi:transcriptional regulator with XRE-family HTH domain
VRIATCSGNPSAATFACAAASTARSESRLSSGLGQEQVADRMQSLGHPWRRVTVSEVERGRRNVTVPELISLRLAVGANIKQLLDPRGPAGGARPEMRLVKDESTWASIAPMDVTALVCSHKTYAEVVWVEGRLKSITFWTGRPNLTDVGPGPALEEET